MVIKWMVIWFCLSQVTIHFVQSSNLSGVINIPRNSQPDTANNPFARWLANRRPIITRSTTERSQNPSTCASCSCGLVNGKTRIVGGQTAEQNKYPWIAQILFGSGFFCGGSLINDFYILTAAHCATGFPVNFLNIRLLNHQRTSTTSTSIERKISKSIIHSQYNTYTFENDIALLKLDRRVEMSGLLRPVCLPNSFDNFAGQNGIAIGWGYLSEYSGPSQTLQEVSIPILTNNECRSKGFSVTENMLCAGVSEGGKDACQGDSGGPLLVVQDDLYSQVGIVSFGNGCGRPNTPGVYTRLNKYLNWVRENTRDACYCQ